MDRTEVDGTPWVYLPVVSEQEHRQRRPTSSTESIAGLRLYLTEMDL